MYSAYEVCWVEGCHCDHRSGVWTAENVTLAEAYRSLGRAGYRHFVIGPTGEREVMR